MNKSNGTVILTEDMSARPSDRRWIPFEPLSVSS